MLSPALGVIIGYTIGYSTFYATGTWESAFYSIAVLLSLLLVFFVITPSKYINIDEA